MNTTIYIRKENEARWKSISDKSAWVNAYLAKSAPNSIVIKDKLEPAPEKIASEPSAEVFGTVKVTHPEDLTPDDVEQPCCKHPTRPCKHWVWDNDMGDGYKNTLSGRTREAE